MKQTKLVVSLLAVLAAVAMAPASAAAEQVKFGGIHPIAGAANGAFCYIEFPHVHVYTPDQPDVMYRVQGDHHYFVGDPVAFGYDGPKHSYYGHHPVSIDTTLVVDVDAPAAEYCYLDGAHFHDYEPPPQFSFALKGDAYWFIGKLPKPYHKDKKKLVAINAVYAPIVYERPVVVVDAPPPGYVGAIIKVGAPVVEVHRPRIEIDVPVPSIDIHVGGGVIIDHRHHHKHKKHKKHKGRHWH